MPVEVRELIIKAMIVQDLQTSSNSGKGSQNNAVSNSEELVKVCTEKVLEILKDKYER